jgi:general secretion pathway protein D
MKMRPLPCSLLLATAGLFATLSVLPGGVAHAQSGEASAGDAMSESINRAREVQRLARAQAARGENSAAVASYDYALTLVQPHASTNTLIAEMRSERAALAGAATRAPLTTPAFAADQTVVQNLLDRARSQYLAGDVNGAEATFKDVETRDPSNVEAKDYLRRIAESRRGDNWLDREKTREQMLEEVSRSWQRPGVYQERQAEAQAPTGPVPLVEKLNRITIPSVNFTGVELSRVISTLSSISEEFDDTGISPKGVNIVLIDPQRQNPAVNITLRNLTLRRVLDFITDSVGFQYEVQLDAVVVRPGGEISNLETEFFPVSRATVIRMVGSTPIVRAGAGASNDPFAPSGSAEAGAAGGFSAESVSIQRFLQQAGVAFDGTPGASLVYDGSAMIVTQTSRNLTRIRNILNRYNDIRQVEIEAKFMDVAEGVMDELGIDWMARQDGSTEYYRTDNRPLNQAFSPSLNSSTLNITTPDGPLPGIPVQPPSFPGGIDLGANSNPLALVVGTIQDFGIEATIRALARKTGTDLLSAPKVTVLSGNPANITVAQEFRYPQSYGDIESQVGQSSGALSGGSAGVTITAGTPQDFTTRNVGVELTVTPTVEDDDYSISLDLNPRVTEFDGFVEYGGTSVAVAGGSTVTVPSGFFQPIFSVREIQTKVAVWDGATLVMGGLTREEIKRVNDKVPVLGDVPLLGRLFKSEGESTQKRNLLIFVTANLVSPGGSLKKQTVRGVTPNSLFQNPTIVTPGGSVDRAGRR